MPTISSSTAKDIKVRHHYKNCSTLPPQSCLSC